MTAITRWWRALREWLGIGQPDVSDHNSPLSSDSED